MIKIPTLFLFIISVICSATAQEVLDINENTYRNIGKKVAFKKDAHKNLTFNQIEKLPDSAFTQGKTDVFNGGTGGNIWWVKIRYTAKTSTNIYLVLNYGNIDYIDIYYRDSLNREGHIRSGTFATSSSRAYASTQYIFSLPEDIRGDVKEIYIKAQAPNTLLLPIKLVNGTVLAKAMQSKYIWQIISIGIAFTLFLFNVMMLILTRDRVYGLYIIRILALFYVYVLAYLNGYAHFFGESIGRFVLIHAQAFAAVGFIATIYFNNLFLDIRKNIPAIVKIFNIIIFLWMIILVVSIWDVRAYTIRPTHAMVFISSLLILYTSIVIIKKRSVRGNPFLLCYALGWIPICIGSVYLVLALVNILPFKDYTLEILTGVGVLEGTLISMALVGDRVRILTKDKEQAEQRSHRLIRERNAYLEKKIEQRTAELRLSNEQLIESNGYKDKLFSIIAHDMRSPLSSLKGVLQIFDRNLLSQEQLTNFIARIKLNTEQVQKTMDNLLNWSISQMEMQRYQPEIIDLKTFLLEHVALYETLATNKEIVILVSSPDQIDVMADKNQLSLICRNLIDNAIKFTPQTGLINIEIELNNASAWIRFANSGKPIPKETIDIILNEESGLTQASHGTSGERGTGLGLQLCKEFIKNLKNELKIEADEQKQFTIFSFYIPLANH